MIAFAFILWHVFQMHGWFRFSWWTEWVTGPLGGAKFDPENVATAAELIQGSTRVLVLYAVGLLASVYHLANGLWTMGITWGVWTSPDAQKWANVPCALFGIMLAVVGLGSLVGMMRVELPQDREPPTFAHSRALDNGANTLDVQLDGMTPNKERH